MELFIEAIVTVVVLVGCINLFGKGGIRVFFFMIVLAGVCKACGWDH